jgi:phage-related protein
MEDEKQIRWVGSAYDDLLAFPKDARKEAGFQLGKVQVGLDPTDWKPFDDVGAGTYCTASGNDSGDQQAE